MSARRLLFLVCVALAAATTPVLAQEGPDSPFPGEEPSAPPAGDATAAVPGAEGLPEWPREELETPPPLRMPGERAEPRRPGEQKYKYWEEEGVSETVVDETGAIYRRRTYGGVIPNVRDSLRDKKTSKVHQRGPLEITWVGFQQKALFSRVFVQTDRLPTYTIFKPDPLHIVVEFPTARLRTVQEDRVILTHEFNTKIDQIDAKPLKGRGIHVVITLKEPMGYLYKQEGDYVFIDVER
jgi:hypothetical protein